MRLIQFLSRDGARHVGAVEQEHVRWIAGAQSVLELALHAIAEGVSLEAAAEARKTTLVEPYAAVLDAGRLLTPVDHPDAAHVFVTGTGLTHLGSANARDQMHARLSDAGAELSDSMKIFKMGVEGGKPPTGEIGVQPEWFWKGNGSIMKPSGAPMESPDWALDMGEEPEIAGVYLIGPDGTPFRLGFALANEMSDHVMERSNYLLLAHSKLRQCALGPELRLGDLPADIRGVSRILRDGAVLWQRPFLSGEANMTHAISNLEHHHFKYPLFCNPGDVHVHVFGTATISFADGVRLREGDEMEIDCPTFGQPLRNPLRVAEKRQVTVRSL
ncbi:AraD1 family protein [Ensifer sp.]|jgi:hypothetical protein|uniref:AraD1 family protein n=1 Tax=Ensifer sp. TaxID=1872086 RepID=UPI002E12DF8A|nr:AraD1 family protein [Ensifer sp.]